MEPLSVNVEDAGRIVGLSRSRIYQMIADGQVEVVRFGRRTVVKTSSLRRLVGEAEAA